MTVRADHIAAIALACLGIAAVMLGSELPFGTAASPGPGMLPLLCAVVLLVLSVFLFVQAASAPPALAIVWDDLPHAVRVMAATAAAAAFYEALGFPITVGILLFSLIHIVERQPLAMSIAVSAGMTAITYFLLGTLLKTPMPPGIFGI